MIVLLDFLVDVVIKKGKDCIYDFQYILGLGDSSFVILRRIIKQPWSYFRMNMVDQQATTSQLC